MSGRYVCEAGAGNDTILFGPGQLAKLFGTEPVPLNAQGPSGGYNQLTFALFGGGTWSVDVNLTGASSANWIRIATALASQTTIVSLGGTHPGVFVPGAGYSLPAFTFESARIVRSVADADGRIDVVAQGFNP